MDWIATLLIILLTATLLAYYYDIIAYPFGFLILLAMLVSRILFTRNNK